MSFVRNIRDINRVSQVANVLMRNGLGYVIAELGLKYHIDFVKRFSRFDEPTSLPKRVRQSMEDLGGAFVKLGQLLSLRPDLVPAEYCHEFRKLQDEVKPLPFKTVKSIIEKELGTSLKDVFQTFDEDPIGSASIAQVHKASLKNKKMVVVKVQRPDIRKKFSADIDIMHYFAERIEAKKLGKVPANMIVSEFEDYTKKELDFRFEANNIRKFYDNFRNSKIIRIPKVYENLSNDKVLVMEYIKGKRLSDIKPKASLAHNLIDSVLSQVLEMDIFHADLHPGNIMVMSDGRLALLDFGIVGTLNARLKNVGLELLAGIVHKDSDVVFNALIKAGASSDQTDFEKFRLEVGDIVDEYQGASISEEKVTSMLHRLFNSCYDNHITIPGDVVLLAKALVTAEGTCLYIDPKLNFRKEFTPRVERLLAKRAAKKASLSNLSAQARKLGSFADDFSHETLELIRKLKHGTVKVDIEDTDIKRLGMSIDRSSNRLSYGVIIASMLVAGSLMSRIPGLITYKEVPVIPVIFFVGAFILGAALVSSIFKEGKEKIY